MAFLAWSYCPPRPLFIHDRNLSKPFPHAKSRSERIHATPEGSCSESLHLFQFVHISIYNVDLHGSAALSSTVEKFYLAEPRWLPA